MRFSRFFYTLAINVLRVELSQAPRDEVAEMIEGLIAQCEERLEASSLGAVEEERSELFKALDVNHDGSISFDEWLEGRDCLPSMYNKFAAMVAGIPRGGSIMYRVKGSPTNPWVTNKQPSSRISEQQPVTSGHRHASSAEVNEAQDPSLAFARSLLQKMPPPGIQTTTDQPTRAVGTRAPSFHGDAETYESQPMAEQKTTRADADAYDEELAALQALAEEDEKFMRTARH